MSGLGDGNQEDDIMSLIHSLNDYLQLDKKFTVLKAYAQQHPIISLFWGVTLAMCSIPIICFCTFVCATVFLTITGFVLIEGTVVTLATVLLGGALLIAILLALGFSSSMVLGFFAIRYSLDLMQGLVNRQNRSIDKTPACTKTVLTH